MTNVKSEGLFSKMNLVGELKEFIGRKVNVEIGCGETPKRFTGGTLVEVGSDFIQLNGNINIIFFVPGIAQPVIKKAKIVVIPINRLCNIEVP